MADDTGYFLTADIMRILAAMAHEWKRKRQSTQGRPAVPDQLGYAPEVYIARTPVAGIPELKHNADADYPGYANCQIYQMVSTGGDPYLQAVTNLIRTVYNLSTTPVEGNIWIDTQRDKYGRWLAGVEATSYQVQMSKACPIYGTGIYTGVVVGIRNEYVLKEYPSGKITAGPWCVDNPECCPVAGTGSGSAIISSCCPGVLIPETLCADIADISGTAPALDGFQIICKWDPTRTWLPPNPEPQNMQAGYWLGVAKLGAVCTNSPGVEWWVAFNFACAPSGTWYFNGGAIEAPFPGGIPSSDFFQGPQFQFDSASCEPFYLSIASNFGRFCYTDIMTGLPVVQTRITVQECGGVGTGTGTGIFVCTCKLANLEDQTYPVNADVSVTLSAVGCVGAVTWNAIGLPLGLGINPFSGEIFGTIVGTGGPGVYTVTITVTDSLGCTDSGTFIFTVVACSLVTHNPGTQTFTEGDVVDLVLTQTGGMGVHWPTFTGSLPPGLTLVSVSGRITGTITAGAASGSPYTTSVLCIEDNTGCTSSTGNFQWVISPPSGSQTYTTPGTYTFTAVAVTNTIEVWGSGAGGSGSAIPGGQGGGGGGYSQIVFTAVIGNNYTVNVGAGGGGGAPGVSGGNGNTSWFSTTGTVLANGGSNAGTGGSTTGAVGTTKHAGGNGAAPNGSFGGGGGSSAGTAADGGNGANPAGGTAPSGGGNGGAGGASGAGGSAGSSPGGGGGAGGPSGGGTSSGGAGADGKVVITW